MKSFRWKNFAVIYDDDDNLIKFQDTFSLYATQDLEKQPIKFYKLPKGTDNFRPVLKDISKSGTKQVIIDCTIENTFTILRQSIAIGMNSEYDVSSFAIVLIVFL